MLLADGQKTNIEDYAVGQNLTTLRNRVTSLVSLNRWFNARDEPYRCRASWSPGYGNGEACSCATANLEFRLEALPDSPVRETQQYEFRANERVAQLERDIITTGNSVGDARSSFDENGMPQVNISLDASGGRRMADVTKTSVGRRMAVIFIESRTRDDVDN